VICGLQRAVCISYRRSLPCHAVHEMNPRVVAKDLPTTPPSTAPGGTRTIRKRLGAPCLPDPSGPPSDRRQIGGSQEQQNWPAVELGLSGAEDEGPEILGSGSGTLTRCCRPLARFLPSGPGTRIVERGILPKGDAAMIAAVGPQPVLRRVRRPRRHGYPGYRKAALNVSGAAGTSYKRPPVRLALGLATTSRPRSRKCSRCAHHDG
jgi:hypothetical protein